MSDSCKLNSYTIKLQSNLSGLSIEWINKSIKSFMILSKNATLGTVFETVIPAELLLALFQRSDSSSKSAPESCIVACNSGEVILVYLDQNGDSLLLCKTQGIVIWVNYVNDKFILVKSCGKLLIGTGAKTRSHHTCGELDLEWSSVILPLSPICCSVVQDILVLSDGYSSYMYQLWKKDSQTTDGMQRLPFSGIVHIQKKGSRLTLLACDGRQYVKSLKELKEDAHRNSSCESTSRLHFPPLSLEKAMRAIKSYSESTAKERDKVKDIDSYLEQICIAQMMLSDPPSDLFSVNLVVLGSEGQEGYPLAVHLKRLSADFRFRGPWWLLNVKLKGCQSLNVTHTDFNQSNSRSSCDGCMVLLIIPFNFVENLVLECDKDVNIELFLTFSHFSLSKPLCTFKIHEEPLDMLYFLTSVKNASLPLFCTSPFITKVAEMFQGTAFDKRTLSHSSSHHQTYLILQEEHVPSFQALFPEIPPTCGSVSSVTRWLQNIPLNLSCERVPQTNYYKITLESEFREVSVAAKSALEKRGLRNMDNNCGDEDLKVKLTPDLFRKSHVSKVVLNLESDSSNLSESVVKRIYESISNLMSGIPL